MHLQVAQALILHIIWYESTCFIPSILPSALDAFAPVDVMRTPKFPPRKPTQHTFKALPSNNWCQELSLFGNHTCFILFWSIFHYQISLMPFKPNSSHLDQGLQPSVSGKRAWAIARRHGSSIDVSVPWSFLTSLLLALRFGGPLANWSFPKLAVFSESWFSQRSEPSDGETNDNDCQFAVPFICKTESAGILTLILNKNMNIRHRSLSVYVC